MIVGLGFNKEVGKDTAATALCRELGFKRIGFADALKDLAFKVDPLITSSTARVNVGVGHGRLAWTVQGLGWDDAKRTYPEVRQFLQRLGHGARETFGEEFWTDIVKTQALSRQTAGLHTVISDVRYRNEADLVKEWGGMAIKIVRPGKGFGDSHITENDLVDYDGWDLVIENNGSIVELEQQVVQAVRDRMPKVLDFEDLAS